MQNDFLGKDSVYTIYFGGGTPSLLEHHHLKKIMKVIQYEYDLASNIEITLEANPDDLFQNMPEQIQVGRYHSWVVHPDLPESLVATSVDENGQIMSLRHKTYDVTAVQFHPESVLTPEGKQMLKNWLNG